LRCGGGGVGSVSAPPGAPMSDVRPAMGRSIGSGSRAARCRSGHCAWQPGIIAAAGRVSDRHAADAAQRRNLDRSGDGYLQQHAAENFSPATGSTSRADTATEFVRARRLDRIGLVAFADRR